MPKKNNNSTESEKRLGEYLRLMEEENLHELEISDGTYQVKLVRQPRAPMVSMAMPAAPAAASPAPAPEKEPEPGTVVRSPLAGIFYRARSPQSPPFVNVGDRVNAQQTLCIVEAMKVMNEISAGADGTIAKILVENGKAVESGQPIFQLTPS